MRRRAFLSGAGGIVVGLPFLDFFRGAARSHHEGPGPQRLIVFVHQQGTIMREWAIPGASETDFRFGRILEPLEAWKSRMVFLHGIDNALPGVCSSNGHSASERTLLSAQPFVTALDGAGNLIPRDDQTADDAHAAGPSIDQVIAERIRMGRPYKSIDLAVGPGGSSRMLYAGREDPVTSIGDPREVLANIFAPTLASREELDRIQGRRLSALDAVRDSFQSLRGRLGTSDRRRLDAHAEKVRDLELRVAGMAGTCRAPDPTFPADYDADRHDWTSAPIQMELLTLAMSCDLAPVGTLLFRNAHSPFDWLTYTDGDGVERPVVPDGYDNWHDLVHDGRNRPVTAGAEETFDEPGLIRGYRWYTERFVELLELLDGTPEGDGSMLDHTMVLWISDFGNGRGHNNIRLHAALAGNVGAASSTGRCIRLAEGDGDYDDSRVKTNNLYVSMLQAFGQGDETFGYQTEDVTPGGVPGF
jgi:hypothetical protein